MTVYCTHNVAYWASISLALTLPNLGVSAWFWLWLRSFFATYSQYLVFFFIFFNDFGNYAQLIRSEAKLLAIFSEILVSVG